MWSIFRIFMLMTFISVSTNAKAMNDVDIIQKEGDWILFYDAAEHTLTSTSANNPKSALSYICQVRSENCMILLLSELDCEINQSYTALLVDSNLKAHDLEVTCKTVSEVKGQSIFEITPNKLIEDILAAGSGHVAIILPINNGAFEVIEISLNGSKKSINTLWQVIKSVKGQ